MVVQQAVIGTQIDNVTVSLGHESRHALDRYQAARPPYNINWLRLSVQLGAPCRVDLW